MKRFLVFVVVLIVAVSLGATVVYFMRDDEQLVIRSSASMYANVGEDVEVDAELKNAKIGHEITYTSLNPDVLEWNPAINKFMALKAGAAVIQVSTNNKNLSTSNIYIEIGDGSKEAPYFIDSYEDLILIGAEDSTFGASNYYILKQDINIPVPMKPLLADGEFTGSFDGNNYTITGLTISEAGESKFAGLFGKIGDTGVVSKLTLKNVNINGQFSSVGAIAGMNLGTITRCEVLTGIVQSSLEGASVGGICGVVRYSNANRGRIDRCLVSASVVGQSYVGGLAGRNEGAIVINSYTTSNSGDDSIKILDENGNVGGIIGYNTFYTYNSINKISTVKNCYSIANVKLADGVSSAKIGYLIGWNDEYSSSVNNNLMGLYSPNSREGSVILSVNNEYALSNAASADKKAKYRGVYNNFPLDANSNIIKADVFSFYAIKGLSSTESRYWDFVEVWELDVSVNNGYPTLNKFGADVADEISIASDPSIITTVAQLNQMRDKVNAGEGEDYYLLDANLVLTGTFEPIGTSAHPFTGVFEGNGKTITGLNISTSTINNIASSGNYLYAGLFGKITNGSTVKNLILKDVMIENGANFVGAVVGYNEGVVDNVTVLKNNYNFEADTIVGNYCVGGIAGINLGTINNCKVANQTIALRASNVDAERFIGGIVGQNGSSTSSTSATVSNCSLVTSKVYDSGVKTSLGDLKVISSPKVFPSLPNDLTDICNYFVGGIAGTNGYKIRDNYVYDSVIESCTLASNGMSAGIVGRTNSTTLQNQGKAEVEHCKVVINNGNISGCFAAGICARQAGKIEFCHAEVNLIEGVCIAGLVNHMLLTAELYNCYSNSYLQNINTGKTKNVAAGAANQLNFDAQFLNLSTKNYDACALLSNVFSTCTFSNEFNQYNCYDTNCQSRCGVVSLGTTNRIAGITNNFIFVETGTSDYVFWEEMGAIIEERSANFATITRAQATCNEEYEKTVALFTSFGFSSDHWEFLQMQGIYLKGFIDIDEVIAHLEDNGYSVNA